MSRERRGPIFSRHHLRPRCRFPPTASDETKDWHNIAQFTVETHRAIHHLFGVLDPRESEEFLRRILIPGRSWSPKALEALRQRIMTDSLLAVEKPQPSEAPCPKNPATKVAP